LSLVTVAPGRRFSALQRAENSSINTAARATRAASSVSVLFSEPKIPQCRTNRNRRARVRVSVLFSEPKIPQSGGVILIEEPVG